MLGPLERAALAGSAPGTPAFRQCSRGDATYWRMGRTAPSPAGPSKIARLPDLSRGQDRHQDEPRHRPSVPLVIERLLLDAPSTRQGCLGRVLPRKGPCPRPSGQLQDRERGWPSMAIRTRVRGLNSFPRR